MGSGNLNLLEKGVKMFDVVMSVVFLGLLLALLGVFFNSESVAEMGLSVFLWVGLLAVILACIFAILSTITKLTGS